MRVTVLGGAGAMGRATVMDLCASSQVKEVLIGDINDKAGEALARKAGPKARYGRADIMNEKALVEFIRGSDVVVNCTQYYHNIQVMTTCIAARAHYTDLGGLFHQTRRQMELDNEFKAAGLTAVLGMGGTPGTTNVMAALATENMDVVTEAHIRNGCADFSRSVSPLSEPYSIQTILDEFSLEPMVFTGGEFKAVPPLTGSEMINFPEPVGRAEALYTIHSEVATFPLSWADKGIQEASFKIAFPTEFLEKFRFLVALGMASKNPIEVSGQAVVPREFLSALIASASSQADEEPDDCDILLAIAVGEAGGQRIKCTVEMIALPYRPWGMGATAVDTGVPPSIVAQMMASGEISRRGVFPPEVIVPTQRYFQELAKRNMHVRKITEVEVS